MTYNDERMKALGEELEAEARALEMSGVELDSPGSEVFRLARELGTCLKNDPRMKKLELAKKDYEEDEQLQKLLTEYDVQQRALERIAADPEPDTLLVDMIQNRTSELYNLIVGDANFKKLTQAQEEATALMDAVNNTISYMITGRLPECTHDCSSCGGSCHTGA